VGFGEASFISRRDLDERQKKMQDMKTYLYTGLNQQLTDIRINGSMDVEKFSPAILNVSFLGVRGEVLLHMLEEKGIYVSTGSACSSHHKGDSPVLTAMGLTQEEIQGAIRFSFSEDISYGQLDYVIDAVHHSVHGMRRIMNYRNNRE
jgi:cysteine desulfurase